MYLSEKYYFKKHNNISLPNCCWRAKIAQFADFRPEYGQIELYSTSLFLDVANT